MEAAERRTQTRNALNNFGGDARAAEAAALRQAALAEMREAVEQYVRVRSSATLLQWAIERYRREKQAPLLKRTGEIFAMLTGNSFIDLRLEFNDDDSAQLAGLRPDGRLVRINGMSTGTADQLYLALRVASVEDYLTRANAVPFVADDLFINFDNERAAAGFNVLGQLAQKLRFCFLPTMSTLSKLLGLPLEAQCASYPWWTALSPRPHKFFFFAKSYAYRNHR